MTSSSSEQFTFFFRAQSPFSQWHPAKFTAKGLFGNHDDDKGEEQEHTFQNCEQWMMFNKAVLFKDAEMSRQILATSDPKECKSFGRKVKHFDDKIWKQHREQIVYEGNRLKFLQNGELRTKLMETVGTTMVEASPFDTVYGIGLSATNPKAKSRVTWRGLNLLGQILTRLRDEILAGKHSTTTATDKGGAVIDQPKTTTKVTTEHGPATKISKSSSSSGEKVLSKKKAEDETDKKRKIPIQGQRLM